MAKPKSAGISLISAAIFLAPTMLLLSFWAAVGEAAAVGGAHELSYYFPAVTTTSTASSYCDGGSIENCLAALEEAEEEDEDLFLGGVEMESESSETTTDVRRMLYWRRRYISYGALMRDRVPCSRRGHSYYNCRPGRAVNPYHRGCNAITRCRSF